MKESGFQRKLIQEIRNRFPGCVVLKNDPTYIQGFPDILVLYEDRWAALEVKCEEGAKHQPNQDRYVGMLNSMSYSAFIYPANKEEILHDLEKALRPAGGASARLSEPE